MAHKYKFNKKKKIGNQYYYFHADTEDELNAKIDAKKAEVNAGIAERTRDKTVSEWAEFWVATYKEPDINIRYLADIKSIIKKRINPHIGKRLVRDVKPSDLKAIMNSLAEDYSDSYIKKTRAIIKAMFKEAYINGQCDPDPAATLKLVKSKATEERRSLTDEERAVALQVAEYHRFGLFILLMLYAGLRPGEVAALQWTDINIGKRLIYVHEAVKSGGEVGPPKSGSGIRIVSISQTLFDRLQKEEDRTGYVVTNASGGRYTKSSIRQAWETFKRQMEIVAGTPTFRGALIPPLQFESLVLYDFRHTYISNLETAGVSINVARRLAGHKHISTTAEFYTHTEVATLHEAASKLDELYAKID